VVVAMMVGLREGRDEREAAEVLRCGR